MMQVPLELHLRAGDVAIKPFCPAGDHGGNHDMAGFSVGLLPGQHQVAPPLQGDVVPGTVPDLVNVAFSDHSKLLSSGSANCSARLRERAFTSSGRASKSRACCAMAR